jgi:hypothetical protein
MHIVRRIALGLEDAVAAATAVDFIILITFLAAIPLPSTVLFFILFIASSISSFYSTFFTFPDLPVCFSFSLVVVVVVAVAVVLPFDSVFAFAFIWADVAIFILRCPPVSRWTTTFPSAPPRTHEESKHVHAHGVFFILDETLRRGRRHEYL